MASTLPSDVAPVDMAVDPEEAADVRECAKHAKIPALPVNVSWQEEKNAVSAHPGMRIFARDQELRKK